MKHRTWLLEALRLHFAEKLPRIEAGQRLGIPKTTVCDLFVRFRQAGLSWPLPAHISAKTLDKRLYRQALRQPGMLVTADTAAGRKRRRRPNLPREFRIALVRQSMQPGVSVAQLARENNINTNLLFNWRRHYQQEPLPGPTEPAVLLPVTFTPDTGSQAPPPTVTTGDSLCCELVLPAGTLRILGELTPDLLQMLIREMLGGER